MGCKAKGWVDGRLSSTRLALKKIVPNDPLHVPTARNAAPQPDKSRSMRLKRGHRGSLRPYNSLANVWWLA